MLRAEMPEDEFLTTGATAKRLGKVPNTIRKWERRGELAAIRTTTNVRLFRRSDVEKLAEKLAAEKLARARAARSRRRRAPSLQFDSPDAA
jgi:excisionase family DNA binding protein